MEPPASLELRYDAVNAPEEFGILIPECDAALHGDFVRQVASLVSRSSSPHVYEITPASLYNAYSIGWTIRLLSELSRRLAHKNAGTQESLALKKAFGALVHIVHATRAAWLTLPSATAVERRVVAKHGAAKHGACKTWRVSWPTPAPTLQLQNAGELFMLLTTESVRKALLAAEGGAASSFPAARALGLVSLELRVIPSPGRRALGADAPAGPEDDILICSRVSGVVHQLTAGDRLGTPPAMRLRYADAVPAVTSLARVEASAGGGAAAVCTFALHTAPLDPSGEEATRLSELSKRLAAQKQAGVMQLGDGGAIVLVAVHSTSDSAYSLTFLMASCATAGATAGGAAIGAAIGVAPVSDEAPEGLLARACMPPASPPPTLSFPLFGVPGEITRRIEADVGFMPTTNRYQLGTEAASGQSACLSASVSASPKPIALHMSLRETVQLRDYQQQVSDAPS